MATFDRDRRRLDFKVVYWGPSRGGKTTSLRSLHGSFDANDRGELSAVETQDERTYYFDYAPLCLPRYRDHAVRVHAYTVPGEPTYVETRRRILRGADGVVFVADATRDAQDANLESWRQLDEALKALEGVGSRRPVVVAVNKRDLPGTLDAEAVARSLHATVPTRQFVDVTETVAVAGKGVWRAFRSVLVAAVDSALASDPNEKAARARGEFLALFDRSLPRTDDAAALGRSTPARRIEVPTTSEPPQPAAVDVALAAQGWLVTRELDLRDLQRERALARFLLEVGQVCLAQTDTDALLRRFLSLLVMNLDAVTGWVGIAEEGASDRVWDPMGPVRDPSAVRRTADVLRMGLRDGTAASVGSATSGGLPGGAAGGEGQFVTFDVGGGRRGWLLLVGPPNRGLPPDADSVLGPAGAFLGLALSRVAVLHRLREANVALEQRVEERTQELVQERSDVESRVRERTVRIEREKQAVVDAERRNLDREREESVQKLAAGLAHEVNNPIGAVQANLDFVLETLRRVAPILPDVHEADDLITAVEDARRDSARVAGQVSALFGGAASSWRATFRTLLGAAARDAVRDWVRGRPDRPAPQVQERRPVHVGVAPGECARWMLRLLSLAEGFAPGAVGLVVDQGPDGPCLSLEADQPTPPSASAWKGLADEIARAGARLTVHGNGRATAYRIVFPSVPGEAALSAAAVAR